MAFDSKNPAGPEADGVFGEPTKKMVKVYLYPAFLSC